MSDELDSRAVLQAVSRRRRLLIGFALVGLGAGVAYGVAKPAMPQATTQLLLPSPATQSGTSQVPSPSTDAATQVAIATSDAVLSKAARAVSPPLPLTEMRRQVKVRAASSSVLSIEVRASRGAEAERLADAVAHDYIAEVTSAGSTANGGLLGGLSAQAAALTKQLNSLKSQVAAVTSQLKSARTSAARHAATVRLGVLEDQSHQVNLQLNTIEGQILQDRLSTLATNGVIRVLEPATASTGSSGLRLPLLAAIGLLVGSFVGFLVALSLGSRDRRLFRRADFAGALGLPVIASLRSVPCRRVEHWSRLLQQYEPSTSDQWNLHRLLRYLEVEDATAPLELEVLAFADDRAALPIGPQLAMFAVASGVSASLATPEHPALEALRAACLSRPSSDKPDQLLTVPSAGDPARSGTVVDAAGNPPILKIALAVADQERPSIDGSLPSATLLAVSAGFATPDDIARLALVCADAGHRLSGFVLVNPDPADRTSGELPGSLLGWRPRTQPAARSRSGTTRSAAVARRTSSGGRRR